MTKQAITVLISIITLNVAATSFNAIQTSRLYSHFESDIVEIENSSDSTSYKQIWEYKVVELSNKFSGRKKYSENLHYRVTYAPYEPILKKYSTEGWELISIVPLVNTDYVDFSKWADSTPGIKSHIFTSKVRFIFQRRA